MKASRRAFGAAMVAGAMLLAGCGGWNEAKFTRTDTLSQPHVAMAGLDVEVANGSVSLTRAAGDAVTIEAVIRATTQERLDATHVVVTRESDQTLSIRVDWPEGGRKGSEGCSVTVQVPDAGAVSLVSSNGRLDVEGVGTELDLRTSNGRVEAIGVPGPVNARTSNGRVVVHDVRGGVTIVTSNGQVEVKGIGGAVDISTSNGNVDVQLADGNTGPMSVDTSNGSVSVWVGAGFAGELKLDTSNGGVRVPSTGATVVRTDKTSATLRYAEGSERSRVHTSNGTITVNGS